MKKKICNFYAVINYMIQKFLCTMKETFNMNKKLNKAKC